MQNSCPGFGLHFGSLENWLPSLSTKKQWNLCEWWKDVVFRHWQSMVGAGTNGPHINAGWKKFEKFAVP
jgi:hypothetical protein